MEIWKDIYGCNGNYQVSNLGNVRSKSRGKWVIMKPTCAGKGYSYINIGEKNLTVHRLVASAFIPNPEGKLYVDHINNIKTDNRVENLQWVTPKENSEKYFASYESRKITGGNHYNARMTNEQVIEYRMRYNLGESIVSLATEAGVHYETMRYAIKGKTFKKI